MKRETDYKDAAAEYDVRTDPKLRDLSEEARVLTLSGLNSMWSFSPSITDIVWKHGHFITWFPDEHDRGHVLVDFHQENISCIDDVISYRKASLKSFYPKESTALYMNLCYEQ